LLIICWLYLIKVAFRFKMDEFPGGRTEIKDLLRNLGKTSYEEKLVLLVFIGTALLWITRKYLQAVIPALDDTIIAIFAGLLLFLLPSSKKGEPIMRWREAVKMPWGIMILFGGGMALATGFQQSGLANWIGSQFSLLENLPLFLIILILVAAVNFLTEITSNLATTAMLLPILAPIALSIDVHPYMLLVAATVAASCAFMLPVATPPNAVVFGSGYLTIPDMVKRGFWLNIFSIFLLSIIVYFVLSGLWGFDPDTFPAEFRN